MSSLAFYPILSDLKRELILNIKFLCILGIDFQRSQGSEVIIVTKDDKVFSFGNNKYGCLGLGHNNAVIEPQIVNELCDQQIIDISYGTYHVLALTKSGKCFSWGSNEQGVLGYGTQNDSNKPKLINALINKEIIDIKCGSNHSFVLTKSGDLYGFGFNSVGHIGCGNTITQTTPIKIEGFNNEKIVSISCGAGHSIALTYAGAQNQPTYTYES
jgi:RCC1 and BTB domain-containing protein